ncbi:MAG: hypothetical protein PF590_09360, partial [Candidatus Delongbacteria bacterium]|nr:hypothetical protein [Candidatus Delongbacteria bacterium]
ADGDLSTRNLQIANWNTAYSWGDHDGLYKPVTWLPEWTDVNNKPNFATVAITGSYTDLSDTPVFDSTNWNTAYTWGNHDTVGYLTEETDPVWNSVSDNYYTESMLQDSGQSQVHYGNLTNVPDVLWENLQGEPPDLSIFSNDNIGYISEFQEISLNEIDEALELTNNGGSVLLKDINYWNKNGDNLYYNDGNVGIRTSHPETSLEINGGSLKICGSQSLNNQESARLVVDAEHSSAHRLIELRNIDNGQLFNVCGNGKVGIGIDNPTSKLHVRHFTETDWSYGVKIDIDNKKTKAIAIKNYDIESETYRVMGNGTVIAQRQGIGTYSPRQLLHIHNKNTEPVYIPQVPTTKDKGQHDSKGGISSHILAGISKSGILLTNYYTGKNKNDGLLIKMHNKDASITNQENGSLSLKNNGSLLVKLEQSDNLSITGGNLAMNNNQIRFRGSGDQNHRINYTNNNGLDGLHIQGNIGVEIATQHDGTVMTVKDGNVGVGEENPSNTLSVWGGGDLQQDGLNNSFAAFVRNSYGAGGGLWIRAGSGSDSAYPLLVQNNNDEDILVVRSYGKVGIGTANPEYPLDVDGRIRSTVEVLVKIANWGDYIFEPDYMLEAFDNRMEKIKQNKHLPYSTSGEKIENEGLPVSETVNGLTKNVEEMYLYIEALEKRISELEQKLDNKNNQ